MIRFQIFRPSLVEIRHVFSHTTEGNPLTIEVVSIPFDAVVAVNVITMEGGTVLPIRQVDEELIGAYLGYGKMREGAGEWLEFNGVWTTEWASNPRLGLFEVGPEGAQWVCLQKKDRDLAVELSSLPVLLPAGTAAVVAKGTATCGGVTGSVGQYFAPIVHDTDISGSGDILLIT